MLCMLGVFREAFLQGGGEGWQVLWGSSHNLPPSLGTSEPGFAITWSLGGAKVAPSLGDHPSKWCQAVVSPARAGAGKQTSAEPLRLPMPWQPLPRCALSAWTMLIGLRPSPGGYPSVALPAVGRQRNCLGAEGTLWLTLVSPPYHGGC